MKKGYNNRQMKTDDDSSESKPASTQIFFFPKENPPVSIEAESLDEAREKLSRIKNKNYE